VERVSWGDKAALGEREEKCIPGNLKERDYMEGLGIDGKTNIPLDLKEKGLEWLRVNKFRSG
jgi:hypothetical protein